MLNPMGQRKLMIEASSLLANVYEDCNDDGNDGVGGGDGEI